jgi:hypothetical protein
MLTVAAPSSDAIFNGGFETGTLSGWTPAGTTSVVATAHAGLHAAQLGSTAPTNGDSSLAQSFDVPQAGGTLSFWYRVTCPDTLTYDWATATLTDDSSGVTTTLLAKTCTNTGNWSQVTANLSANAGHNVTFRFVSHDDNYPADPTYTLLDDVSLPTAQATPDFAIAASPASRTITQGAPASYTVTVTAVGGFSGVVSLGASGLGAGASGSFSPASVTGGGTATFTVTTTPSAATGSFPLTITGTSGVLTHSTPVTLVVNPAPAGDFSLSISPPSATAYRGRTPARYTVNITRTGGFAGAVSFTVSGTPANTSASFSPNPSTTTSSTLSISATGAAIRGQYTVTVTGTSGGLTHSVPATLVVSSCHGNC